MATIKIKYTLNDGYVGESPQYLKIDADDWNALNEDEKEELVDELIKQELSYDWKIV